MIQRQSEGKRVAMGDALRTVAREYYSEDEDYNSVTFLMDGDTVLSPHTVKDSLSFFMALPELGALTTNEVAYTPGGSRWYKDWFNMKFGQRHIMFGSHALSMRVLTLTGRFSAFRTAAVVRSVFIEKVEQDFLEEPFHGRFRFLMGDDKSTWFQMLKEGWDMLYLPDRVCYALESRGGNLISESLSLLYRWYGNTFRNNKRALALGPKRVGGFLIWLSILDQKLSMWTALVGITSAIILSFRIHPVYLAIYIAWVLLVRSVQMAALAVGKHPVSIRTIPLMLYNQWIGALVKIWVNSHLAQQKWQKGAEEQDAANLWIRVKHPLARVLPNWAMLCSTLLFILVLCFSEEVLKMPDIYAMAGLFRPASNSLVIDAKAQGVFSGSNDVSGILNRIIQGAPDFSVISLPRGELQVKHPIVIKRSNIAIAGEETTLVGSGMNPGDAVILIQGESRKLKSPLAGDLDQGSSALWFENRCPLKPRDVIIVRRPNDEAFFDSIGSVCWRRKYPYIRQEMMQVTEVDGDTALLNRDLFFSYPGEKAEIFLVSGPHNVVIRDLTVKYQVKNATSPPAEYENLFPKDAVDLVRVELAHHIGLENLNLINAGRHPLNLEKAFRVTGKNIHISGAWNKGKGGNGYLRLARAFECHLEGVRVKNIRHITFQWSSAYNTFGNLHSGVDVNFHGGYPHHNRVINAEFKIPPYHRWKPVVYVGNNARFAPPNGPANLVEVERDPTP